MMVLDEDRWAELVIAAKRLKTTPPDLFLRFMDEGLIRAAKQIGDLEYAQACRDAADRRDISPMRHEFDNRRPGATRKP